MKTITLDKYLTEKEINEFEKIYEDIDKKLSVEEKKWEIWVKTAEWMKTLEKKDLFFKNSIGIIQKDILYGYSKIVQPLVEKNAPIYPILGTLLGFYRDRKLIAYDDDLDLGIDIEYFRKIKFRLYWISLCKGWHLKKYSWFTKKGKLKAEDHSARLFSHKNTKFIIGKYSFIGRAFIDLWPIAKIPENYSQMDSDLYFIHLHNLYYKKIGNKFKSTNRINWHYRNNKELLDIANQLFADKNSITESRKWLQSFYYRLSKNDGDFYMPLEKGMNIISNFPVESKLVEIENCLFNVPNVDDDFFEFQYGDWKIEKITHIHFIRYKTIKKINKL